MENNLPVVGEDLCAQGREMSWLQIMRYYEETEHGFHAVHVPTLCQQCGDAPCEPVCPVEAIFEEEAVPDKWKEYTAKNAAYFENK